MSPKTSQILNVVAALLIGAIVGAYGWRHFFSGFFFTAEAVQLSVEISKNRAVLHALDRNDTICAKQILVKSLESSLEIAVPTTLERRMDQRAIEDLRRVSAETSAYLIQRAKNTTTGGPCAN